MDTEQSADDIKKTEIRTDNYAVRKKSDIPIDKGWAWVVLAGCVIEISVYGGIMRSFGVFFIQFQERFQASASATALMSLIQNVTLSLTSIFVMSIGLQKFSSRVSVFFGGILTVTGFLITAFTRHLLVYYFAQGFLCGVGMAFIHAPELAIIGAYFNKYRGIANGIFTSGGSIGGLTFAPVVVKLFDTYHFSGAMLIISGMIMHILVGALLLRPIDFYLKRKTDTSKYDNSGKCQTEIEGLDEMECKQILLDESGVDKNTTEQHLKEKEVVNTTCFSKTANIDLTRFEYEIDNTNASEVIEYSMNLDSDRSNSGSGYTFATSADAEHGKKTNLLNEKRIVIDITRENSNDICKSLNDKMTVLTQGCCSFVVKSIFDVHLLRNPCFVLLLMLTFTFMTGHTVVLSFIPAHAKQMGISNESIGILISISAAIDLFARISVGFLVDRHITTWSTILAMLGCVLGTCCHLLRYASTFTSTIILVILLGFCSGQFHSLFAVVYMDVIGIYQFKRSLGFGTLIQGASTAIFIPLTGYLRDVTGSYIASYHMLGVLAYISAVLVLIIPMVKRWRDAKHTTRI